eukprot:TRINITY_DN2027_c2_g1_i1.p1 TRINITY_DN2027_c2_g1~~TRINITY_DN2027_c2_g1_i1.p1  ORF type:complete len:216 (+),score=16.57 TRINITY_DN2027_c2_g1_i1:120-767(+)
MEENLVQSGSSKRNSQVMLLMKGHPACGKSTIASELCRQLRWPLIDKDDAKDCFLQYEQCETVDWNALSYRVMWRTAETQIKLGLDGVVVDSPLATRSLFHTALQIAKKYGVRVIVLNCECRNEEVWKRRLRKRCQESADLENTHKPQTWEQVQQLLKRYDGCWKWSEEMEQQSLDEGYQIISVDTSLPLNQYITTLVNNVKQIDQNLTSTSQSI